MAPSTSRSIDKFSKTLESLREKRHARKAQAPRERGQLGIARHIMDMVEYLDTALVRTGLSGHMEPKSAGVPFINSMPRIFLRGSTRGAHSESLCEMHDASVSTAASAGMSRHLATVCQESELCPSRPHRKLLIFLTVTEAPVKRCPRVPGTVLTCPSTLKTFVHLFRAVNVRRGTSPQPHLQPRRGWQLPRRVACAGQRRG
jgi:hypothetical protein